MQPGVGICQTAMFGMDPNWGRILAAAGRSGVFIDPDKTDLYFGFTNRLQILNNGQPTNFNRKALKKYMKNSFVKILLDLNLGKKSINILL